MSDLPQFDDGLADQLDEGGLDACDIRFDEFAEDDETAALRPLFPDGDPSTADDWHELFGGTDGA